MDKVIVYIGEDRNGNEAVCIVTPSPEALELYGLEAIALKDVPAGKPFKIFNREDAPWESPRYVDPSTLTDGVGGNFTSFE